MIPIAVGELFDKISILEIKLERIDDTEKLINVNRELSLLKKVADSLPYAHDEAFKALQRDLKAVNEAIWDAENLVREVASREGFGEAFAAVAKVTYQNNDRRAAIKREISQMSGSSLIEEKSHSRGARPATAAAKPENA